MSRNTQYQCLNGIENHVPRENYQGIHVHLERKEDYGWNQRVPHKSQEVSCRFFLYPIPQYQLIQLQNLSGLFLSNYFSNSEMSI